MHTPMLIGALCLDHPKSMQMEGRGERNNMESSLLPLTKPLLSQGPGGAYFNEPDENPLKVACLMLVYNRTLVSRPK